MTEFDPQDPTPPFQNATLKLLSQSAHCPDCGVSHEADLVETDSGSFVVPDHERFIECECGALIDIGWNDWVLRPTEALR